MIGLDACAEEHRWIVWEIRNHPEVRRWMGDDGPISAETHDRWYSGLLVSQDRQARVVVEGGTVLGMVQLVDINARHRRAALDIYLDPDRGTGRGVGTAALYLALDLAFGELRLHRFECEVLEDNVRARRLYERLGFRAEGLRREAVARDDRFLSLERMAILEDEWRSLRERVATELRMAGLVA